MRAWIALGVVLPLASVPANASACPICLRGMRLTTAQHLAAAERAVLAVAAPDGTSLDVVEIVKGPGAPGERIGGDVLPPRPGALPSNDALLLLQGNVSPAWIVVGRVAREHAGLLRRLATDAPDETSREARWREHVAYLLPFLEDDDPMIAEIAYAELSRAPYPALRSLKGALDPEKYVIALDDPDRRTLYTLLYGIAGGQQGAGPIGQRLDAAWRAGDASNLMALLVADLELRGPSRVAWIERTYLVERDRTLPEIRAALLALSVQGSADAAISRERVIRAYRVFMKHRRPMASFVVQDLARWRYWDAAPEFLSLLRSGALPDPASRLAVAAYLRQTPYADMRAAVDAMSPSDPARRLP